jgi:hypothetical protein
VGEQAGRYFLVLGVERGSRVVASGGLAPDVPKCPAASLSTEGQLSLVDVTPVGMSHYSLDEGAA